MVILAECLLIRDFYTGVEYSGVRETATMYLRNRRFSSERLVQPALLNYQG